MLLQAVVTGLTIGSIYVLVAAGLTLIFGVMRIINLAHGELLMVGMYATFVAVTFFGIDPYVTLLITIPLLFVLGAMVYRVLIGPVLAAPHVNQALITVGLSLLLQNFAMAAFTADFRTVDAPYFQNKFELGTAIVGVPHLVAFSCSLGVTAFLYWLLRSTELGRQIRAASQDYTAAGLVGIDVPRVYLLTFALGAACVGAAGPLLMPIYYVSPFVGNLFTLTAFVVIVLGGMGNFVGALIGGLIVGMLQSFGEILLPGSTAPVIIFIAFIGILLFRPQGLLGGRRA